MSNLFFYKMEHRSILQIGGIDRVDFLQSIISNDIRKASDTKCLYALLLTPQGKFLFDFFITEQVKENNEYVYLLDCEASQINALIKKLTLYRLHADVTFTKIEQMKIWFVWGEKNPDVSNIFPDPRHPKLGWRLFSYKAPKNLTPASYEDYHQHRIKLGIAEAGIELTQDRFPLECNLDFLDAIDFNKGCYIGQEVTSRMKRRADGGHKRLAYIKGTTPLKDKADIFIGKRKIGMILSHYGNDGLGLVRRDRLLSEDSEVKTGEQSLGWNPLQLRFLF